MYVSIYEDRVKGNFSLVGKRLSLLFFSLESVHNIDVRKDQKDGLFIIWSLGESFGPWGVLGKLLSEKELSLRPVTTFS